MNRFEEARSPRGSAEISHPNKDEDERGKTIGFDAVVEARRVETNKQRARRKGMRRRREETMSKKKKRKARSRNKSALTMRHRMWSLVAGSHGLMSIPRSTSHINTHIE